MKNPLKVVKSALLQSVKDITDHQDIVVFSHLRWEFVTQRPQHILTRLAKKRKIIFVEEPIPNQGTGEKCRIFKPHKNIIVVQPYESKDNPMESLGKLVKEIMDKNYIKIPILWFYSPMFVDIISYLPYSQIVYDCMDELSAFKNAPKDLIRQENKLLQLADVVFTGGKSLYESKRKLAESVYCFPSSVDQKHFAKSRKQFLKIPKDLENIKTPIVGFYGVLDERIDTQLLADLAKNLPQVSFVLIGPVVKINPDDLPNYPNLYYLGGKPYQELPNYLRCFDVAFMPFAINDATRYISPTKTLEFIAAGKPILSTRIADVVSTYSEIIPFFSNVHEFANALSEILTLTPLQKKALEKMRQQILKSTSWDMTVLQMEKILNANNRQLIINFEKTTLSITKKGYSDYAYS